MTDTVTVHYTGTLRDGSVFDSSRDRGEPANFALNRVIPCWTEALQRMKVGGTATIVCPSDIAYGDRGAPGGKIKPGAALKFEVELISIEPIAPAFPALGFLPVGGGCRIPGGFWIPFRFRGLLAAGRRADAAGPVRMTRRIGSPGGARMRDTSGRRALFRAPENRGRVQLRRFAAPRACERAAFAQAAGASR